MVLNISESGVLLDGSAKAMAGLPAQAFAISLSGSVIEDMIACVQNGGDIQLALGSNPKFLFDDHELRIPKTSDPSGYDLFRANSEDPSSASKFAEPTMSILKTPKQHRLAVKAKAPRLAKPAGKGETVKKAAARAPTKSSNATPNTAARPTSSSAKEPGTQKGSEDAAAKLKRSFDNLAADKRENSYGYQDGWLQERILTWIIGLLLSVVYPIRRGGSLVDCSRHTPALPLGHYHPVQL